MSSRNTSNSVGYRTPPRGGGKPTVGKSPRLSRSSTSSPKRSPLTLPKAFRPDSVSALVYEKGDASGKDKDPTKRQGIWKDGYDLVVSPSELWMFPEDQKPKGLDENGPTYGVWAVDPGVCRLDEEVSLETLKACEKIDSLWFYGPKSKIPSYVRPRGVWILPQINLNIQSLNPDSAGFLHLTDSIKQNKLDVGGSWKMLYRRDGLPDALPLGPGISPRKNKPSVPKMTLICRTPNGTKIPIPKLLPTDRLSTLRDKIQELEGSPPEDQRLLAQSKELGQEDNDETLANLGLKDGDLVDLEGITVFVQTPKGRKLLISNLSPRETIGNLKDYIEHHPKSGGIPKDHQRLFYRKKPLENDTETLRERGIVHNSVLRLEPARITVRTPDGASIPLDVDPLNDTLEDVQELVQKKTKIPVEQQHYQHDGKDLKDPRKTLDACGIGHGDVLDLEPTKITVRLPDGQSVSLQVSPTDTLRKVQDRLRDQTGLPAADLDYEHEGRPLEDPFVTLKEYGIGHGDILDALDPPTTAGGPMRIHVKDWKNKTILLDVDSSDTISDLKNRLAQKKDLRPKAQVLHFEGTHLDDDQRTLAEYGIQNGSTVDLDKFKIYIQVPNHGKFVMDAEPGWKVKRIKQSAGANFELKPEHLKPKFNGEFLEDDSSLRSCGIGHKDTVLVLIEDTNIPEYDVHMSAWQDPFSYTKKSPYKKKEGVRRNTIHDQSKDFYGPGKGNTALTVDIWDKI